MLLAGCGGAKTKYVVVHEGKPFQVLAGQRIKAQVRLLGATDEAEGLVEQDIGGWVTMPPDHWDAIQRALQKQAPR